MPAMSLEETYEMYKERARVAHLQVLQAKTEEEHQEATFEEATNLLQAANAAESLAGMWASRITQCGQESYRALSKKHK